MGNKGKVYLVGAGPGDPGLITVKGLKCLAEADVIVYDYLIDQGLLSGTKEGAELIYVGKKAGAHTLPQEEINAILLIKAEQGKMVVRLKGGDPFILGRGGEEAEALAANNIPFEVVPGVTAAVAAPAYAGIPLTHRRLSSSFAVATGHEESSAISKLASDTLVFLMGVANLASIIFKLTEGGLSPATPAALIQWGTTPRQKVIQGTLSNIVLVAEEENITPPAVLVVGKVVELHHKLSWFETKPLFGKRVLVTREKDKTGKLQRLLKLEGAWPIEVPAIKIEATPDQYLRDIILRFPDFNWLILTSVNGVQALFDHLYRNDMDARKLSNLSICAIGSATAESLRQHGLVADLVPSQYTSQGILDSLRERGIDGQKVLLLRSQLANSDLPQGLLRLGAQVEEVAIYHVLPANTLDEETRRLLAQEKIDVITFTSPSTIKGLMTLVGGDVAILNKALVACLGPVTATQAREVGLKVDVIAEKHTMEGLVKALVGRYGGKSGLS
jgi:uroporphyrinogen III methyltransferase/synthase